MGQTRNKSVSFDPEPKVCEFVEYSKKQLKKMRKQERKQNEIATKKLEAAAKKAQGKHKGEVFQELRTEEPVVHLFMNMVHRAYLFHFRSGNIERHL